MRIDALAEHNVPSDLLAIWRDAVGPELLPVQARAVSEFGLFADGNLIVFAPTSSGKTFVGEMAAARAARANTRVVYLVPQKALADEKYEAFRARYAPAGLRVVVASRDRREFDAAIEQREFDLAVVVVEKLAALLAARPDLAAAIGLVVVDELQLLTDPTRGPALELLLTRLRRARGGRGPRIVGLSAVLGRAEALAAWLDARLLVELRRPVELRKGVLCRGTFTYREHNAGSRGTEPFRDLDTQDPDALLLGAAEELARRGEPTLVFVPDRASSVALASRLADRVALPPPPADVLAEFAAQDPTLARDALRAVVAHGIAFHNADLTPEERRLVERHFRAGAVRVLVATSTLAVGMNLPARNVVLSDRCWRYLAQYRRWSLIDLSKSDYENMSGRAGRLGFGQPFGRSILVTWSKFRTDVWLDHYVDGAFEDIAPTLDAAPLEDHVTDLLASGAASSRAELAEVLLGSFTGVTRWRQAGDGPDEFRAALARAVERCLAGGLAVEDADGGGLVATRLGHACARTGIGVATTRRLATWAREARVRPIAPLEVLTVVGLGPAGDGVYVPLSTYERRARDYRAEALAAAHERGVADRPVFADLAAYPMAIEFETARALKKALLLSEWIDEQPARAIEARFDVWAGAVRRIGEDTAWLVDALAEVARACGWPADRCAALARLADRLQYGVLADALPIARLRVPGLGRTLARRLVAAGFGDPATLREAGPALVRHALGATGVFDALWQRLVEDAPPPTRDASATTAQGAATVLAEPAPSLPQDAAMTPAATVYIPDDVPATPVPGVTESVAPSAAGTTPRANAAAPSTRRAPHTLRFVGGHIVEIDGVRVRGEIVAVLRALRELFLDDQRHERPPAQYRLKRSRVLSSELGLDDHDGETIRRRVHRFRQRLATAYQRQHGRVIADDAIIENPNRGGYRLNPRTVVIVS